MKLKPSKIRDTYLEIVTTTHQLPLQMFGINQRLKNTLLGYHLPIPSLPFSGTFLTNYSRVVRPQVHTSALRGPGALSGERSPSPVRVHGPTLHRPRLSVHLRPHERPAEVGRFGQAFHLFQELHGGRGSVARQNELRGRAGYPGAVRGRPAELWLRGLQESQGVLAPGRGSRGAALDCVPYRREEYISVYRTLTSFYSYIL